MCVRVDAVQLSSAERMIYKGYHAHSYSILLKLVQLITILFMIDIGTGTRFNYLFVRKLALKQSCFAVGGSIFTVVSSRPLPVAVNV